jgi:periplasmic protein CpxP/Spy
MKMIIAVLISTFAFGSAFAQSPESPAASASPHVAADAPRSTMMKSDAKRDDAVEHHITDMHTKLKITSAEESQWKEVADTMRENAKAMDKAIDKRDASLGSATAIDDLNAYADIAQAHATGVKKLAKSFSGLYSMMSDDQKKEADEIFSHRNHEGKKVANR